MYEKREIVVFENGKKKRKYDDVAVEVPLKVFVNGKKIFTSLCSPENLEYLAIGMLFTSGLIKNLKEIKLFSMKGNNFYLTTKKPSYISKKKISLGFGINMNGRNKKFGDFRISAEKIFFLMNEFEKLGKVYRRTGGVHSAAMSDGERLVFFHEDIGRHNAFDKVVGECLLKGMEVKKKIMLSSGRITSEIVLKSMIAKIPLIVSISAPTTNAIELARSFDITIAGFVRGNRMNVYTHYGRVI